MPHTHQEGKKRLIFTLLRPGGESRAGLSNRSEIAFKSDKRKVAWTWIVFNSWAKVRSLTQYRLAALSCSVSAEEEHTVFLITSHMCEVERYEQGIRHKSHYHSTFKHGVRLAYNSHQCLTKWLNCDVLFDCIWVYWCVSWRRSVTEAWVQSRQWGFSCERAFSRAWSLHGCWAGQYLFLVGIGNEVVSN